MFHELFVVDSTVSVDVCAEREGDDLCLGQVHLCVFQALDVLQDL